MRTGWKKLKNYYRPYKKLFWADMFFAALGSFVTLIIPLVVKYVVDVVIYYESDKFFYTITFFGLFMIFMVLIKCYCSYFISYYGHFLGCKIERDMRNEIFKHYQLLPISYFDNQKIGKLMSRVTHDLYNITNAFHHIPEDLFISVLTIFGAFFILIQINFVLALIVISVLPFLCIHLEISIKNMKKTFEETHEKMSDVNSQLEDSLAGIRVVKSFTNEEIEIKKFEKSNDIFLKSRKKNFYRIGLFYGGTIGFISLLLPLVAVVGTIFIHNKLISISDLTLFIMYISTFVTPIYKILGIYESLEDSLAGYRRFLEILKVDTENYGKSERDKNKKILGKIEFDNITFRYSNTNKNIFNNFNLSIKQGEYIALVGNSGVGKSTLCSLIPRFYETFSGTIKIDGIDIKNYSLKELRSSIGIVQQDLYLFDSNIKENIKYGNPNATDQDIIEASKKANLHNFIMSLPNRYDTYIGQKGIKLSGGQKQRISIARVFLKNPPILIFDEATSSLDNKSEKHIQQSLELLSKGRTTIVIAHRLSTVINANRILVLTDKGIVEEGTHNELISRKGAYFELYSF